MKIVETKSKKMKLWVNRNFLNYKVKIKKNRKNVKAFSGKENKIEV